MPEKQKMQRKIKKKKIGDPYVHKRMLYKQKFLRVTNLGTNSKIHSSDFISSFTP